MSNWMNKLAIAALVAFSLSACIEERVVVKIKKDGSGVVEHYSYNNVEDAMGGFLSGIMEQNATEEAAQAVDNRLNSEFNDEYFEKFAADMGEGVTVQNYELGNNAAGMKGYHATYAFEDVNKMSVKMRESTGQGGQEEQLSSQKDALTQQPDFSMNNGVLRIKVPHQYDPEAQGGADDMSNMPPQMMGMMAAMFKGMRIAISIEGLDSIKETNAHHRNGDTVVLTDIRMDKLMGDMDSLQKMQKLGSLPREEMQAFADATDGMDIDLQEEIVIRF